MGDDGHDSDLELPIKLGGCSNGEYVPPADHPPVEAETDPPARRGHGGDPGPRELGMSRRTFLRSVSGRRAPACPHLLDARTAPGGKAGAAGAATCCHPGRRAGDLDRHARRDCR